MHFSGGQIPVADLVFVFICFLRKKNVIETSGDHKDKN